MAKTIPAKKGASKPAPVDNYSTPYQPQIAAAMQAQEDTNPGALGVAV